MTREQLTSLEHSHQTQAQELMSQTEISHMLAKVIGGIPIIKIQSNLSQDLQGFMTSVQSLLKALECPVCLEISEDLHVYVISQVDTKYSHLALGLGVVT